MMEGLRSYLLSIFAAALICGIVNRLVGCKGTQGTVIKMITGVFLTFIVIRPMANISLTFVTDFTAAYGQDASIAAAAGEELTQKALASGIKSRCEAYILDKAEALNVALTVEVTLTNEDIPVPCAVRLTGKVSPYAKSQLQSIIAGDLGIDKEHQTWI